MLSDQQELLNVSVEHNDNIPEGHSVSRRGSLSCSWEMVLTLSLCEGFSGRHQPPFSFHEGAVRLVRTAASANIVPRLKATVRMQETVD